MPTTTLDPVAMRGDPDAFGHMFVDLELRSNSKLPARIAGWQLLYPAPTVDAHLRSLEAENEALRAEILRLTTKEKSK